MCGIVGKVSSRHSVDASLVIRMRDTMVHRGPDDAGVWSSAEGTVVLGHRRLSILDLSQAGHQPMLSSDGRYVIVFNGEIYNYTEVRNVLRGKQHKFRTGTDTEVILAAFAEWGRDCLEHLVGMFALAIFDTRSRKLFLARDRAGEKPLFYAHQKGGLFSALNLKR